MASPSKEERVLALILGNSPFKHWHFEEIVKKTDMTRAAVNKWLNKYQKEGLLNKTKEKGKFPHYTVGSENREYQSKKRIYILTKLYQSGMIKDLISLEKAKTIILFGSTARGDWYKNSDIDIFIYGNSKGFEKIKYELKLRRDIELHVFETEKEIENVRSGLINNVINGYVIKGSIQDIAKVA